MKRDDFRIQFILKRNDNYNHLIDHESPTLSTGLYNSVSFIHDMLTTAGINSDIAIVVDNDCIDREVTRFKPNVCIIEALWVTPSKFSILTKLHPDVTWVVRLHSDMPFIANEGIAMDWIADYARFDKVLVGPNSHRMLREVKEYLLATRMCNLQNINKKTPYLPNYYPLEFQSPKKLVSDSDTLNISCFGAVRPLKNHLMQAHAALRVAENRKKKLNFHINGNRLEQKGEPVLNNLKSMFSQVYDSGHRLIMHDWLPHDKFLELCGTMDVGMQVSFSETFNIVAADTVSMGVPIIGSREIPWCSVFFCANPTDSRDIVSCLDLALTYPKINNWLMKKCIREYSRSTLKTWLHWINSL